MTFYSFAKGVLTVILKAAFRIEIKGIDNIPQNSKAIICSNHISLLDPLIVGIVVPRRIYFMAKSELFKNKILKYLLNNLGAFPVNRGEADLSAIKNSIRILKNENLLGIFPEGTRVKVEDVNNAKPGIAMISIKSKAPIVPIYIESKYKIFGKVKVIIGAPIELTEYYEEKLNTEDYKRISKKIMDSIYNLGNQ